MTTIEEVQQFGRAKNAVLSFLERRLSVPKIYLDAEWDGHEVDLLAIDREGVGDVHAVLMYPRSFFEDGLLNIGEEVQHLDAGLRELTSVRAQFKYLAFVDVQQQNTFVRNYPLHSERFSESALAPDGVGRIGLLKIDVPIGGDPRVVMEVKPERFRAKISQLADEYMAHHEADWELRA